MTPPTPIEVVREVMALLSMRTIAPMAQYFHEDAVFEFPYPAAGAIPFKRGRAAVIESFMPIEVMFKRFVLTPSEFYFDPAKSTVIVEFNSFGVLAATDTDYHNRYVGVIGFRDGKIILWREYLNPEVCNHQLRPLLELSTAPAEART